MPKKGRKKIEIDLEKVEQLASRGLTKAQVASAVGISESQWYARESQEPDISEAYKRGKTKGVGTIANSLFEAARSGNITAQIFFLKCQGGWREAQRVEISGPDGGSVKVEVEDARQQLLDRLAGYAARISTQDDPQESD